MIDGWIACLSCETHVSHLSSAFNETKIWISQSHSRLMHNKSVSSTVSYPSIGLLLRLICFTQNPTFLDAAIRPWTSGGGGQKDKWAFVVAVFTILTHDPTMRQPLAIFDIVPASRWT